MKRIHYVKSGIKDFSIFFHLPGLMAIPAAAVAVWNREWPVLPSFIGLAFGCLIIAQLLYRTMPAVKGSPAPIPMLVVVLSWFSVSLLDAIPFYAAAQAMGTESEVYRAYRTFPNAWFEAMSGITVTGLSMAENPQLLPFSLQFWRSINEWVGGLGIVVFALAVLHPFENNFVLYNAEAREERVVPSLHESARDIWVIYCVYTGLGMAAFWLLGMPAWEAVNHAMTAISTGGFSITGESFQGYESGIKIAAMILMFLGAVNFQTHYQAVMKRNWRRVQKSTELKVFLTLLILIFLLLYLLKIYEKWNIAAIDLAFHWMSALSTCGFSSTEMSHWIPSGILLLIFGMVVGGCSSSTCGGIKLKRFAWLAKGWVWKIGYLGYGARRKPAYTFNQKRVAIPEAMRRIQFAGLLLSLWIFLLFAGTLWILAIEADRFSFQQIVFDTASALGNVGLSTGVVHPGLHPVSVILFILLMLIGRLEAIGVILLLGLPVSRLLKWKKKV